MQRGERKSGIELIKIFALLAIVISHICQTLEAYNSLVSFHDYNLPLATATTDIQTFILSLFRYGGSFGNIVFLVCSCWFLLDTKRTSVKKIIFMIINIWTVSVIMLVVFEFALSGNIALSMVIKALFPTFFSNNWYLTCYILLYAMHPFLNKIVYSLKQKQLLKVVIVLSSIYILCNFIMSSFESSRITLWVAIYFCIAYMKLYLKNLTQSKKINISLVAFGFLGNTALIFVTNLLGLKFSFFENMLMHWNRTAQPFLIIAAIGLFNLANQLTFSNKVVNRVSSFSMLIYIIHENFLVSQYLRPYLLNYIYQSFGYKYILLWVILLTVIIFVVSLVISIIYSFTIQKIVKFISDKIYLLARKNYKIAENTLIKVK